MKKFFAVVALVAVLASCKDKKKADTPPAKDDTATVKMDDTKMDDSKMSSSDVPKFADADVQKYVDDYTAFVTGYVEAYKAKDMTKIQELSTKASEWASKSQSIVTKLAANPDEATKFSNYMTKLSQDMTAAMTAK